MNKTLIIVLAACLVSVHAFVKRDAEKTAPNTLEDFQKQAATLLNEANNKLKEVFDSDKLKETFDAEKIKKAWEETMDGLQKAFATTGAPEKKE